MRIGLVLPALPTYSETFFRNKISGLKNNDIEIILFANRPDEPSLYMDCKVITAPKLQGNLFTVFLNSLIILIKAVLITPMKSFQFYSFNKKDGILFKRNIKLLIANQFLLNQKLDWLHFGFGTMALGRENVANAIGAKMVVSFRGFDYYVYPKQHKGCYVQLFKKDIYYHVLSDAMKTGLVKHGIPAEKITKITPAIDLSLFSNKASISGKNKITKITSVSRLHPIKGLDFIIRALKLLSTDKIPFHMTIIGDGEEKNRLLQLTQDLSLTDNITFCGQLSPEAVKELLSQTDIYIQYSHEEGFCNAVLEAQAMGLLCIVSDAEGLQENVLDGQTGWVVPKRNPTLLAEKIKKLIQLDDKQLEPIRTNAIHRVQNAFNLEKQAQEFLNFYEKN